MKIRVLVNLFKGLEFLWIAEVQNIPHHAEDDSGRTIA